MRRDIFGRTCIGVGAVVMLFVPSVRGDLLYDNGPIVTQAAVPVMPDDTEATLAERVLAAEHRIYPQAVRWFVEDRIDFGPGDVVRVRGSGVSTDCITAPRDRP